MRTSWINYSAYYLIFHYNYQSIARIRIKLSINCIHFVEERPFMPLCEKGHFYTRMCICFNIFSALLQSPKTSTIFDASAVWLFNALCKSPRSLRSSSKRMRWKGSSIRAIILTSLREPCLYSYISIFSIACTTSLSVNISTFSVGSAFAFTQTQ